MIENEDTLQKTEKLYDWGDLAFIAEDDEEFLISLSQIFIKTIPVNSKELVDAAAASKWDEVSKLAHKLKSTIDSMNIDSIKTDIRTIEQNAKTGLNTETLSELALKVDKVIKMVVQQIKEEFGL